MNKIRAVFHLPEAKQLLTPYWRAKNEQSEIASTGFCYIATEALFHLIGGVDSKYKPCYFKENGESHWWLINEKNRILDPTFDQYGSRNASLSFRQKSRIFKWIQQTKQTSGQNTLIGIKLMFI